MHNDTVSASDNLTKFKQPHYNKKVKRSECAQFLQKQKCQRNEGSKRKDNLHTILNILELHTAAAAVELYFFAFS